MELCYRCHVEEFSYFHSGFLNEKTLRRTCVYKEVIQERALQINLDYVVKETGELLLLCCSWKAAEARS